MATTLRELIAKVVFRADPKQLQDFDERLDAAKAKLLGLDAQAKKGVTPAVDPTPLQKFGEQLQAAAAEMQALKDVGGAVGEQLGDSTRTAGESFIALRDAVRSVEGSLDPDKATEYAAAFKEAQQTADDVRSAINRLRLVDPTNAALPALERQLQAVELEADQTAKALKSVGVATKGAKPGVEEMSSGLGGLTKMFAGLATAAAAYKALAWGKGLVDDAIAVGDLAARLGIGTDELQQWTAFAEEVGASTEDLSGTVKALAKNIATASKDAKGPAAEGFKKLGISTAGWAKELPNTMDVLLQAGGAIADLEGNTERLSLAQDVLSEASLKLLPAFEGGSEAARHQLNELKDLAVVYDKDFIQAATAAKNEMALFERQMDGVGAQIILSVLPSLRDFVRWITPVAKGVRNLVRESNAFGAALGVIGTFGISKLLTYLPQLMARFGGFTGLVTRAGGIFLRFILPFLILDDVITFLRGGKSVLGDILDGMFGIGSSKKVLDALEDTWDGLAGGVEYFWGLLKGDQSAIDEGEAKILKFGGKMDDIFGGLASDFSEAWDFAVADAGDALVSFGEKTFEWGNLFSEAWDVTLQNISDAFVDWGNGISSYFSGLWTSLIDGLAQMLADAVAKVKGFAEGLPIIGGLFKSDAPKPAPPSDRGDVPPAAAADLVRNGKSGLALGGAPSVSNSKATTVTVNDNSSVTTTLNGVDGKNVGAALRASEQNVAVQLKRNKAQILRQTVGATNL